MSAQEKSGEKQSCAMPPTLFAIVLSLLLQYALWDVLEGIYLHTRVGGRLFNIASRSERS